MERSFPRGGSKRNHEKAFQKDEEFLFKVKPTDSVKKTKRKKPERVKKGNDTTDEIPVVIDYLSFQMLSVGMTVLGCISEVHNYSVKVSLPGGIFGKVPITNISDSYSRLLQDFANDPESFADVVVSPPMIFVPGMCFPMKVICKEGELSSKKVITLSLNPKEVNNSLTSSCLFHQMTLLTAVESVEDHGYIMDIGVAGLKGFLNSAGSAAFIQKTNSGRPLAVGQPLLCKINMPQLANGPLTERIVSLVAIHKTPQTVVATDKMNLHNLLPGAFLKGEVREVRKQGLVVDFSGFGGCIWKDHLRDPWDSPFKYDVGQEVECTLLFQHPVTHTLHLTLLPRPNPKNFQKRFGSLKIGELLEEATVVAVESNCLYFKLQDNMKAVAVRSQLSDVDDIVVSEMFNIGDVHRCQILSFSHFEVLARVSLKWSVLHQHVVPLEDIRVGAKLGCIVLKVLEKGLLVRISKDFIGFVSNIHMADVPPKDPISRFPVGKKVNCRVLKVNDSYDPISPLLTCKKSLVKSKLPPLDTYNDVMPNRLADGVVVKITQRGLLVAFYADVRGWVPIRKASCEPVDDLEKLFFLGQVVKCLVLECVADEKKMILSLVLDEVASSTNSNKKKIQFGQICDVLITKKTPDGFEVKLEPSGLVASLPINHLSDHPKLCKILWNAHSEGDAISRAVCFKCGKVNIVSRKRTLIRSSEDGTLAPLFEDIKPGMILQGVVKGFLTFGVFVDVGNGIVGLVHIRMLSDGYISHVNESGYVMHSSITVKVLKVVSEPRRLELSARLSDVYEGNVDTALELLQSFLMDWRAIVASRASSDDENLRAITKFKVGDIVSATVTSLTDEGILCELGEGVKGFAVSSHVGVDSNYESKVSYDALVLHIDVMNNCVELALAPSMIRKVNKSKKVGVGETHNGVVLLLREHFVLAFLDKAGVLVYLPLKRHTNDMINFTYGMGEKVSVKVAAVEEDWIIGSAVADEKENLRKNKKNVKRNKENVIAVNGMTQKQRGNNEAADNERSESRTKQETLNDHLLASGDQVASEEEALESCEYDSDIEGALEDDASTNFRIGQVLDAEVMSVKKFQLNILIDGKTKGRVHVTEVSDSVVEGVNPLQDFKVGQKLSVRVIGFRNLRSHRFTVLTHRWTRSVPEFTLKKVVEREESDISEGQELLGYVREFVHFSLWVWLSPKKTGCIDLLNLSQNPNVLRKVEEKFPASQAIKVKVLSAPENGQIDLTKIRETKMEKGKVVLGLVLSARRDLGVFVRLQCGYRGTIALTDLRDSYKPASTIMEEMINKKFVRCCILDVDDESKTCRLTTRASRFRKVVAEDPEIEDVGAIKPGMVLRGFLKSHRDSCPNVTLGYNVHGLLAHTSFPEEVRSNLKGRIPLGTVLRVKVKTVENQTPLLTLIDYEGATVADSHGTGLVIRKETAKPPKKKRRLSSTSEVDVADLASAKDENKAEDEKPVLESRSSEGEGKEAKSRHLPCLEFSSGFDWEVDATPNLNTLLGSTTCAAVSSSDSEQEEGDQETNAKEKRKTRKQKMEEAKQEEQKLFQEERRFLNNEWQPETLDDFDRLVASSPNSSLVWLKYMAFHLQQAEVDKARAVAERALQTICFRDEQEKLNVWVAMLNLENLYGTRDSLDEVFKRALQHNEPVKVYAHMAKIYDGSEKVEEAEEMYSTMIKKFRKDKEVWINFGTFYMKRGKLDAARKLMQRCLNSLDKRNHIDIISKFAQLEFRFGERERGRTMFEGIVGNYPKRIDQWSVYIDVLLKCGEVESVRNLFERAVTMSLSAKRMKFFFKRYLEFERQQGDEEKIREIQKKALDYVETKVTFDE